MTGCSSKRNSGEYTLPNFTDEGLRQFDVHKISVYKDKINFTDIGVLKDGKFHLKGTYLKYGDSRAKNFTGKVETSTYVCSIPDKFWQNVKNDKGETICEGIIIFEKVPFSFYYNEDGEPYVKCLETRFHSYFKEDRSYVDFINFAVNYEPVNYTSNEDTLSS